MGWFDSDNTTACAKNFTAIESHDAHSKFYNPNHNFVCLIVGKLFRSAGERVKSYAAMYRNTGDERYARKGAILLARLAYMYPCFDWSYQSVEGLAWDRPDAIHARWGRIVLYGAGMESQIEIPLYEAYDLLFDYIRTNQELATFVGTKVPWIKSPEDLRRMIDRNLLTLGAESLELLAGNDD